MSPRHSYAQRLAKSPLLFVAIGLIAGIVVQESFCHRPFQSPWPWLGALGLCSAALFLHLVRTWDKARPEVAGLITLLCFVCLGAVRLIAFGTPEPNDIAQFVANERVLATLRGRIITTPYEDPGNWCFADFAFTDPSSSFYMKVRQAKTAAGWVPTSGTVRVHVDEPAPNLKMGDIVQIYCWLHRFEEPTNPGQFNVAVYLHRRNIHIGASVPARDAIERCPGDNPGPIMALRARLSDAASEALLADIPTEASNRGLLQALLLGDRRDIDPRTYEAFRRTGLLHLISLSGMHLGIFVGMVWGLCRVVGLTKRARAMVCILATALFLLVVPPRAPTVRAAIIVWTFCLAVFWRRHPDPLNTLSLAAIVSLLIRPTQVFEAGWQLSFMAVVGILLLTSRIGDLLHLVTKGWFRKKDHRPGPISSAIRWLGARAIGSFATGLAAWAGGAGVLLYHFYTITPLASFWTVLVFPLVGLILIAGFFRIVLFFVFPTISWLLGELVTGAADLLIRVVNVMAIPNINSIVIGRVAISAIVLYYVATLLALYAPIRRPKLRRVLWGVTVLGLAGYLGMLKWQRTHRDYLSVTALDVGHGQAVVARLPGTQTLLFDAGSLHRKDVGGRIVVPFLDYVGIDHLDAIVISHDDIDHINGIPEVAYRRRVDHIYSHDTFLAEAAERPTAKRLIDCLRQDGRKIESMPRSIQSGRAKIQTLWPGRLDTLPEELGDNDKSLVCSIMFGRAAVLLCSDIERFAQRQIMSRYPDLRAEMVVEPHHGSAVTQDEDFLDHLNPSIVLRSCGRARGTPKGPIAPKSNPKLIDTFKNGAVTICVEAQSDGMFIRSVTYLGTTPTRRRLNP